MRSVLFVAVLALLLGSCIAESEDEKSWKSLPVFVDLQWSVRSPQCYYTRQSVRDLQEEILNECGLKLGEYNVRSNKKQSVRADIQRNDAMLQKMDLSQASIQIIANITSGKLGKADLCSAAIYNQAGIVRRGDRQKYLQYFPKNITTQAYTVPGQGFEQLLREATTDAARDLCEYTKTAQ